MKQYIGFLFLVWMLVGCSQESGGINEKRYLFQTVNGERHQIKTNFDMLKLFEKNKIIDNKNILVFLFSLEDAASLEYLEVLHHLQESYEDLCIIGILDSNVEVIKLQEFIDKYSINFLILNPMDQKKIREDFAVQVYEIPQVNKKQSVAQNKKHQQEVLPLPFLVLYDKNHRKYEYYQGVVVQEMLMHDLSNI